MTSEESVRLPLERWGGHSRGGSTVHDLGGSASCDCVGLLREFDKIEFMDGDAVSTARRGLMRRVMLSRRIRKYSSLPCISGVQGAELFWLASTCPPVSGKRLSDIVFFKSEILPHRVGPHHFKNILKIKRPNKGWTSRNFSSVLQFSNDIQCIHALSNPEIQGLGRYRAETKLVLVLLPLDVQLYQYSCVHTLTAAAAAVAPLQQGIEWRLRGIRKSGCFRQKLRYLNLFPNT